MTSIFPHFVLYYTLHMWFRIYKKRFFLGLDGAWFVERAGATIPQHDFFIFVLANQPRDLRTFAYHFQDQRRIWKARGKRAIINEVDHRELKLDGAKGDFADHLWWRKTGDFTT